MALPNILIDRKLFDEYHQIVKEMGSKARKEGKVYKNCTEDEKLNEFLDVICIYSMGTNDDIVTTTIYLDFGEWANEVTFQAKVNEKYLNGKIKDYCMQIVSWSLIEE